MTAEDAEAAALVLGAHRDTSGSSMTTAVGVVIRSLMTVPRHEAADFCFSRASSIVPIM